MSEVARSNGEFAVSTVGAEALGGIALSANTFSPVVGEGVDMVGATLGHSGDGADGTQRYHVPGGLRANTEVIFN